MAIDDGPVIVGGGPSGLAAAIELRRLGISPVTVIEREREAGGIPRHSDHTGFGLRDLRTVLSGPRYAAALPRAGRGGRRRGPGRDDGHRVGGGPRPEADRSARPLGDRAAGRRPRHRLPRAPPLGAPGPRLAARRGDDHRDAAAARPPARPEGRAPGGDRRRRARQLLGGRDPRPRRRLGRGAGHGAAPGTSRCGAFRAGAAVRYRAPVWTRTAVSAIHGAERVESVELTELDSGRTRTVDCDLVDLHRRLDPRPRAGGDGRLRARSGNARPAGRPGAPHDAARRVRGGEPAASGRDGRRLRARRTPRRSGASPRTCAGPASGRRHVRITSRSPLAWVAPNLLLATGAPAAARPLPAPLARVRLAAPRIQVRQDGRELWSGRVGRLVPGRSAHIPAGWAAGVDPTGGPVIVDGEIGWAHERRDVARHRRGDHRRQGRALRPAAAAGRRGAPRQGEPPSRRRAGSSRTARR